MLQVGGKVRGKARAPAGYIAWPREFINTLRQFYLFKKVHTVHADKL